MLANLAFFSIALPDSTLGVAWPSMRLSFGQPIGAAGLVPPFGVAATVVSTVVAGRLVSRIGIGRLLAAGTLLSAIALVVTATSTTFAQFLVSVVLGGLSGGAIDVTLNAYAARRFGPRRINLLHASYVVGAATSPLLVTIALQTGAGWRLPYAVIAALQLALALVFTLTARRWQTGTTAARPDPAGEGSTRSPARASPAGARPGSGPCPPVWAWSPWCCRPGSSPASRCGPTATSPPDSAWPTPSRAWRPPATG